MLLWVNKFLVYFFFLLPSSQWKANLPHATKKRNKKQLNVAPLIHQFDYFLFSMRKFYFFKYLVNLVIGIMEYKAERKMLKKIKNFIENKFKLFEF